MRKVFTLPFQKQNNCPPETFHPNAHPEHLWTEAKFSKIGWIPLEIQYFSCQSVQVESENFKCCRCAKFSPFVAKVKYWGTWNFPPKWPPSTSSSWSYVLENWLNTFGDIEFFPAQYRLKVGNFKCCRCAKFSPCHCKSKIPAHLKLSTQMPTLNIFELKERFRKSVEYLWRYRIFAGTVQVESGKFQMLSMRKVFTLPLQN